MKVAPALAASNAWFAEKQSVTLTIVPSTVSALQVLRPSMVSGTLIAILSAIFRSVCASFIMPFVDLGLVPEAACSLIFPRLAGRRSAARHLLLGEPFGASEAKNMGLASHVVSKGELQAALAGLVRALLAKPTEALRQTQALLRREDTEAVLERMELENGHFAERLQSDEVKTAITAFFASRMKAPAD